MDILYKKFVKKYAKKSLSCVLSLALILSCMEIFVNNRAQSMAAPNGVIQISSANELAKIGSDSNYPMSGDYMLTADIDLSGRQWIPFGGYIGTKGTIDTNEANVFSGTFDGAGHVISGLTINLSGSIWQDNKYAQVGLFSVISGKSTDYAVVKNIIFKDVDIRADFSDGLSSVGTLAGDVNGYSQIDNIVVLDGELDVNKSAACDTVGAGGVIGECRTADSAVGNGNVTITNCYNGASVVACGMRGEDTHHYAGGIVGRIAKSQCKNVSYCINVGRVTYNGNGGYGVCSAELANSDLMSTVSNCYYIDGYGMRAIGSGVKAMSQRSLVSGTLPSGFSSSVWKAYKNCYIAPSICYNSSVAQLMYLNGYEFNFSEDESVKDFKTEITLPSNINGIAITWKSSNTAAVSVSNGKAIAHPDQIISDEEVVLTATTPLGQKKTYKVKVISTNVKRPVFVSDYPKAGSPFKVMVEHAAQGETFSYEWKVAGKTVGNNSDTYTPTSADLEKFITVKVRSNNFGYEWELKTYFSELPVVYVDTADKSAITSTSKYKEGHIRVQGNDEFNDSDYYYDGAMEIKGRGNSTWWESDGRKRPYKIKLDKKADLYGIGGGKNKHWVLMANLIDHTNMRNEIVSNLAEDLGVEAMATTGVVLILNGEYVGNYELCEHVRVGKSRVNIFDWEDYAEDAAKAVAAANSDLNVEELTTAMEEDLSWVDGSFIFNGKSYNVKQCINIPEFTGGFLLDMDFRSAGVTSNSDYVSPFSSSNGIPLFVDKPENARTSSTMMNYIKGYINAYEAAINSKNFTTTYEGKAVHYTDLFDMDSLLGYWFICEYSNNWDSMKNSTFLYKGIGEKAKMGPVWDYDWAFGNINMYSGTAPFVYDNWHTTLTGKNGAFCEQGYQAYQWNHYLVKDPYFVTKAYELYEEIRPTLVEDIMKDGGKIDSLEAKYQTASDANDAKWSFSYGNYGGFAFINGEKTYTQSQLFNPAVESLKTFITKRVNWFDKQFTSVENLYRSLGNNISSKLSVSQTVNSEDVTIATATVSDSSIYSIEFIVNGKSLGVVPVIDGKAVMEVSDTYLETKEDALNTLHVVALNSSDRYLDEVNFANFKKKITIVLPTPTPSPKPTPTPTPTPTETPTQTPMPTPATTPTVKPEDGQPTQKPGMGDDVQQPGQNHVTDNGEASLGDNGQYVQTPGEINDVQQPDKDKSIIITGKLTVKRKKNLILKVKLSGIKGKVKVTLDKKGKKLLKIKKVTNKKIKLKALNKKGIARLTVKCGKYKVVKKIRVR